MAKDIVTQILGGIVNSAVAPVVAVAEVLAYGNVRSETAETVTRGMVGDYVKTEVLNSDK